MSHRALPSTFVKTVVHNGVGRYVCQMSRVTLKFCKSKADSRGIREFIENHLLEFVNKNPGIVVYLQPRRHRTPKLVAEYLNGNVVQLNVAKHTSGEVCQWLEHLRCRSGENILRLRKTWHTDTPSVQGIWNPFTNLDPHLAVTSLPDERLSRRPPPVSATDYVLKMAQNVKVIGDDTTSEFVSNESDSASASSLGSN